MSKVVIASARRTAIGSFLGILSDKKVTDLGADIIRSVITDSGLDISSIDEVIMGNVLSAGTGQAPARQAALGAGLPVTTECLTINKMCGSGLKAVMLADQAIRSGDADVIIAGGMESMSNAPYLLSKARNGYRLGNSTIDDSIIRDGLWDVYNDFHMGNCAESCARDFKFSREEVDAFAVESYKRAITATENSLFAEEIAPVTVKQRRNEFVVATDEEPGKVKFDKIPSLRPAFEKDGIVTAANASKINDGAAALLICSEDSARKYCLKPLAEIVSQSSVARKPIEFTIAPADAINTVLAKSGISISDIGLFEINEAFAVVSLAVNKLLNLNMDIVNVNGGAIALGHPIGASGARILVTLIHEMKRRNVEFGIASLCIGGGEASAVIIKNIN